MLVCLGPIHVDADWQFSPLQHDADILLEDVRIASVIDRADFSELIGHIWRKVTIVSWFEYRSSEQMIELRDVEESCLLEISKVRGSLVRLYLPYTNRGILKPTGFEVRFPRSLALLQRPKSEIILHDCICA